GVVGYTQGLVTDQPLGIIRANYVSDTTTNASAYKVWKPITMAPFYDVKGHPANGYPTSAEAISVCPDQPDVPSTHCVRFEWPAQWKAYRGYTQTRASWLGTILEDKRDAAQTYYRRNRYYDAGTGRFTQEDPIGLAGGLNVYGFANGDPVNYSDPFGLCPPKDQNPNDCPGKYEGALVQLGLWAPAINHEVAWFLPRNLAAAASGLAIEAVAGRVLAGVRSLLSGGASEGSSVAINIGTKIERQLARRGWTAGDVEQTVNSPFTTRPAMNRATGNSATAYYDEGGAYVVRDDVTGDIVQISNRSDPNWIPDATIQNPYRR
ncbi:MAG TPA: colicin E5-related ribonuclease, partial [Gemmatimonadales bacterium]|nr:colicin E5-related ribonuclease [Gemmatimonadales bacterium]